MIYSLVISKQYNNTIQIVFLSGCTCAISFKYNIKITILNHRTSEVESSRTSLASRTHFEVLGLGLEASSPQKLPCPRLEDSTIFEPLKFRWKTPETLRKICKDLFLVSSSRYRLKKNFLRPFSPEKKNLMIFFLRSPK